MATDDVTLAQWAARVLDARPDLKPKTRASYESLLRSRILPTFGDRTPASLRPFELQAWAAALHRDGLSASRVRQAANLLGSILAVAVDEGLVASNPCATIRLPRLPQAEVELLTAAEVERLATLIEAPYGLLVHVLAYGGLRWGEAAALRRARCDLARGRLHVRESLAEVSGALHFGPPKTHQHRAVALPASVIEELRRHLADQVGAAPDALVFTSPQGSPLRYTNWRRRVWRPATAALGRPCLRIHALRHTCASLLIAEGAPIKAIQTQLGHRSAELTLDRYGHLYPDQLDVLAARLDEARAVALTAAG